MPITGTLEFGRIFTGNEIACADFDGEGFALKLEEEEPSFGVGDETSLKR
jgi:hypothetical protein